MYICPLPSNYFLLEGGGCTGAYRNLSVNIFQLFMTRWRWWWPFSNSVSQHYWQLAPIWRDMFLFVSLFLPGTFSFHPRLQATFDESARCLWRILQSSQERRFQTKENLFSKHAVLVKGTKWLQSPWVINPDIYRVNIWLWFKTLCKRVKPPRSTNKNITAMGCEKLPTYPSPKPKFTLSSYLG